MAVTPRALVLFTGTGSVDRSLEAAGFDVDNLDIDKKCKATWTTDIQVGVLAQNASRDLRFHPGVASVH